MEDLRVDVPVLMRGRGGSVALGETATNRGLGEVWMMAHSLLDEPELAATASDGVLAGGIEQVDVELALDKLAGEAGDEGALIIVSRW